MKALCSTESVGNHNCWIGGVRDPTIDARWIFQYVFIPYIFLIYFQKLNKH